MNSFSSITALPVLSRDVFGGAAGGVYTGLDWVLLGSALGCAWRCGVPPEFDEVVRAGVAGAELIKWPYFALNSWTCLVTASERDPKASTTAAGSLIGSRFQGPRESRVTSNSLCAITQ